MELLTPVKSPTQGIYPNNRTDLPAPIEGVWRLVYTTAYDVLSLNVNPLTITQRIFQVIRRDGSSVNIIDLVPRYQAALPPSLIGAGSTLRLKVYTSAYARSPTRIGLQFLSVEVKPLNLFGFAVPKVFPRLKATLPQSILYTSNVISKESGPGYFDVTFLDENMLVIRQNAPGGYFVSVKDLDADFSVD